ncbi:MAG: hypothetical protein LKG27_04280 [Clostridiaceae bacterium]|nr:hypothetical protein [Clostridiaceae bacterium]
MFSFGFNIINTSPTPLSMMNNMMMLNNSASTFSPHEFELNVLQAPSMNMSFPGSLFNTVDFNNPSTAPLPASNFSCVNYPLPMMPMMPMSNFAYMQMPNVFSMFSNMGSMFSNLFNFNYNSFNTKSNLPQLKNINYNASKGESLAQNVASSVEKGSTGWCAKYVKNAIAKAGLGNKTDGNAYQCAAKLANNPNFKEVNVTGNDLKNLPAGCVIVYNRGAAGYSSKYGHIEISLGNGTAASDFLNKNIKASNDVRVFVPV